MRRCRHCSNPPVACRRAHLITLHSTTSVSTLSLLRNTPLSATSPLRRGTMLGLRCERGNRRERAPHGPHSSILPTSEDMGALPADAGGEVVCDADAVLVLIAVSLGSGRRVGIRELSLWRRGRGGSGERAWWPSTARGRKGRSLGFVGRVVDGKVERETQMLPTLPTIRIPLRWAVPLLAAHPASPRLSEHLRAALNQAEAVPDGGERDTRELDSAYSTPGLLLPSVG